MPVYSINAMFILSMTCLFYSVGML